MSKQPIEYLKHILDECQFIISVTADITNFRSDTNRVINFTQNLNSAVLFQYLFRKILPKALIHLYY